MRSDLKGPYLTGTRANMKDNIHTNEARLGTKVFPLIVKELFAVVYWELIIFWRELEEKKSQSCLTIAV